MCSFFWANWSRLTFVSRQWRVWLFTFTDAILIINDADTLFWTLFINPQCRRNTSGVNFQVTLDFCESKCVEIALCESNTEAKALLMYNYSTIKCPWWRDGWGEGAGDTGKEGKRNTGGTEGTQRSHEGNSVAHLIWKRSLWYSIRCSFYTSLSRAASVTSRWLPGSSRASCREIPPV